MGITEYQRKQRSKFIGSSDIAAIAGLSPFATARDVWCEKTYDMEPRKESTEMRRGNYTELSLLKFAEDELGTKITPNQRRVKGVCAANIDGICRLPNSRAFSKDGIEAKSSNCGWEYGVEGTDQVPDFVALQCAHEMYCGELERIFIPVYAVRFGRMSMELFRLNRDEDIIKKIVKIATNFWYNHVLMGIIPPGATPVNIEILKRIRREPEKIIAFDNSDTVLAWEAARKKRLEAEKAESYLLSQVLESLGDAGGGTLEDDRTFTFFSQKGADKLDRKRLKREFPDIYAEIAEPSYHRVARLPKKKEEK